MKPVVIRFITAISMPSSRPRCPRRARSTCRPDCFFQPGANPGRIELHRFNEGLALFAPDLDEVLVSEIGQIEVESLLGGGPAVGADAEALLEGRDAGVGHDEHLAAVIAVHLVDEFLAQEEAVKAEHAREVAGSQTEEGLGGDFIV
jgi:hypothetical protein